MSKDILDSHREIWKKKRLTRYIYEKRFAQIRNELSPGAPCVEIGAGTGNFKEFMPSCLASDVVFCGWLDIVHDAMYLPYRDGSIGNFVLLNAIHHIQSPVKALHEMHRCLKKGGRIVILDVYISPFSYIYYNFLHKEDVDLSEDVFNRKETSSKEPFASNQAIATLMFFKGVDRFRSLFPGLKMIKRTTGDFLLYPLSGGFEGIQLIPYGMKRIFEAVDSVALRLLGDKVSGRCLVVLEKTD